MVLGLFLFALSVTAEGEGVVTYQDTVRPLLEAHCVECHHANGRNPDLSQFPFQSRNDTEQEAIVQKILAYVQPVDAAHVARMPPGSRPKLAAGDVNLLLSWYDGGLQP